MAWFVFTGAVDPATGMLMNISEIKQRAGAVIDDRYDHRFLNEDNPSFADRVPTAENVARQLVTDVAPLFQESGAQLTRRLFGRNSRADGDRVRQRRNGRPLRLPLFRRAQDDVAASVGKGKRSALRPRGLGRMGMDTITGCG